MDTFSQKSRYHHYRLIPAIRHSLAAVALLLLVAAPSACSPTDSAPVHYDHPTQRPYKIKNKLYYPIPSAYGFDQTGIASWYGTYFHGRKTSNGERYNMYDMTAAHKTLPMNTMLMVKNLENNREIVVRINDRGPFVKGRIIDLSYKAAQELHIVGNGTAKVRIVALGEKGKNQEQIRQMAYGFYHADYYVQIGAFTNPDNAIRLQNRFLKAGHKAVVKKYQGPQQVFYRVQVFVGRSLDAAEKARNTLEKRGYRNAFVVAQ